MSADDVTDPNVYWPPQYGDPADVSLSEALFAIAAELRTANLIAFKVAQQTALADCHNDYVAPIRERLGMVK